MPEGYTGKLLRIDLSNKRTEVEEPKEDILRQFIGGSGLAAKILYEECPDADPLGPDNLLIFMTGPLTGTKVPLSGRHEVVCRSPLTSIYGEADVGGTWGVELKKAGYDGVVVKGIASKPVYVWIHDGSAEFRDATHVWGKDVYETDEILKKETDAKAVTQSIGQAGENLVKISAIVTDGKDGRPAARCGVGAVMGSKKLKSIVARGERWPRPAQEEKLQQNLRQFAGSIVKNTKSLHDFGTSGGAVTIEQLGDMPIKNWLEGSFIEGAKKISGQKIAESILIGRYYCGACVIGCGRDVEVKQGKYAPVHGGGPEYETIAMLGANNLVDNLEAIAKAHELCNRYGMDVISVGTMIGFALECYEHGLINEKDAGMKLAWGDPDVMVELVHKIAKREDIGFWLGEGVRAAALKIGGQAEEFAIHVKGLEFPAHDPRAYNSVALGYATSNRGACHLQGLTHVFERSATMPEFGYDKIQDRFGVEGKGELTAKFQDLMSLFDSLKLCKFLFFGGVKATHALEWLNLVTGWNLDMNEFMTTGERIYNLKRLYNVRLGISRKDDTLPKRILTHKRGTGGAAENLPPLDRMLDEYYRYREWDKEGRPTPKKLDQLGLSRYVTT